MTNEHFSQLVKQYEKLVFTICSQMVRDFQEAQNLSQETFLSAYRSIDSCPSDQYKPWLCRIASNKAKDYLKSAYARRVAIPGEETLDAIPSHASPEDLYIEGESESRAQRIVRNLQEPYQKVSVLYFLEEKSVEEIAEALKRPKKTVQTQLYRAKAMLREQLGKELSQ
ncbi:RNA polymerase sigma factor [Anaeromassilibacillus senegalensis]|uniref:RNA polymerase sigma factor n=1 Tax=Anaeromassilibacillus senegalensis TaxID=1673717 RepID=UPI000681FC06|nr:sigma-70 family RNA polymerase sigma factor [Anaeromassilibacillus senegalensis]